MKSNLIKKCPIIERVCEGEDLKLNGNVVGIDVIFNIGVGGTEA